ncbi:MAG: TonB-dependent receptor, partial [Kamptonema sp. SIO4C4]|nr:TonB-dependent receptor [Kamptonema sp. SIO4C4]
QTRFSPFDLRLSDAFGNNVLQSEVESEKWGGRLDIETPLTQDDTLNLVWGADYFHEDSAQPADLFDPTIFANSDGLNFVPTGRGFLSPPLEQDNLGLFAQLTWQPTETLTLNGGIRQEIVGVSLDTFTTLAGNTITGGDLDYDATLFNIGAVYGLNENLNVFANFAQGFSLADIARTLRTAPGGLSVERLRPEPQKVDNYEIGIRGDWDTVQASLSGFYSYSELGTTFNEDFGIARDPQRIYGIEADINAEVSPTWLVGGTFTWTEGKRDVDGDDDFETPLPNTQIPPIKLTAYVENQTTSTWSNRLQLLYSGTRDPEGTGYALEEVDSYLTADFISQLDMGNGTLSLAVENMFNSLYFPNISQISAGNSLSAARGARVRLTYTLEW